MIDLSPIVSGVIVPLITPVVLALAAYALKRVASLAHISIQDSQRKVVEGAIQNGIKFAVSKLGPVNVAASDQVTAAVNYILPKVPGALNGLGITPDHLTEMVQARLPQ